MQKETSPLLQTANKKKVFRAGSAAYSVFRICFLVGLAFVILYPLLYMVSLAVREPTDLLDITVVWIPKNLTWDNLRRVMVKIDYWNSLGKTVGISLVCSLLQCFSCSLAGYGFARFKFKLRGPLFVLVLLTLMVPPQIVMMPSYVNYVNFTTSTGIPTINTIIPLALPALFGQGLRAGLFIVIFRQFFKGLPLELEDAAYIDGCAPRSAFWRVVFPNAGSILLIVFLFSLVWYWNDYFNVSLYYNSAQPLSSVVANLQQALITSFNEFNKNYSGQEMKIFLHTACLLFVTPLLIIYLFLQKQFTQSIVNAGIVG